MAPWRDDVALLVDPVTYHFEQDRLFDLRTGGHGGDDVLAPYLHLRSWMADRGVRVHTADMLERDGRMAERNVYVSLGIRHRYRRFAAREDVLPSAFFALECPIVEPRLYRDLAGASEVFSRMLSYSTGEALRPFLTAPISFEQVRIPQSFDAVHDSTWARKDRGFLTMINANKLPRLTTAELYTERLRAVEFFARYGEIDLYGMGWDGPPYRLGETRLPAISQRLRRGLDRGWGRVRPDPLLEAARGAWRGSLDGKADTLGSYRFAICFENMVLDGWITEKLFDCLFTGTVPVYLGAPDIERWVPPECFIDMRRFSDYAELRAFLHDLTAAEVRGYRDAGRAFIDSDRFEPFSKRAFAELLGGVVEMAAGVQLEPRQAADPIPEVRAEGAR